MFTIFRSALTRSRGQIAGWGLALALLGVYIIAFYDTTVTQQAQLEAFMNALPPEMMAFFGGVTELFSPEGYLGAYFFSYMPLVIGIYAVLAGSGLLAADEEKGSLDLVLAHPISRAGLFFGRLLGFVTALVLILAITWLGFVIPLGGSSFPVTAAQLAPAFLSLLAVLLVYGSLALLFSMTLPSRTLAASTAGLVLVTDYFISSISNVNPDLESLSRFLPLGYYQGGAALVEVNWGWLAGLLAAAAVMTLLSAFLFQRRDVRVGGEGGWRLPDRRQRRRAAAIKEEK